MRFGNLAPRRGRDSNFCGLPAAGESGSVSTDSIIWGRLRTPGQRLPPAKSLIPNDLLKPAEFSISDVLRLSQVCPNLIAIFPSTFRLTLSATSPRYARLGTLRALAARTVHPFLEICVRICSALAH